MEPWTRVGARAALALVILLLPAASSGAEPARSGAGFSLDDAIRTALASSEQLRLARAGVEQAEAQAGAARAGRRPQATLEELVSRSTNPTMVFSQLLGQERFTADNFALDTLNEPAPLSNFTTRVSVSQSVWSGGRQKGAAEAAAGLAEAAGLDQARRRQEVIQDVVTAYSAALLARDREQVALEALATARAHVGLARDMRDSGLAVEAEVLRAQVRESEVEEMLASARGDREVTLAALNMAMGRDQSIPIDLIDFGNRVAPAADSDLEELVAEAWARRADLQAAVARSRAAGWQRQAAAGSRRPELMVAGMYEVNDDSFLQAEGDNWTALATLRWSLWDGGADKHRVAAAAAGEQAAAAAEDLMRQRIALEVRQAVSQRSVAGRRLDLAARAESLAGAALDVVTDRYREGLAPQVTLLDAEDELTRARSRKASALRELQVAESMLGLALGRLEDERP